MKTQILSLGAFGVLVMAVSLHTAPSWAQIYKVTEPNGRVTFSDTPPRESRSGGSNATTTTLGASSGKPLPFELRQIVSRFPVTLYTGDNCAPCIAAHALLINRGIPFVEKTVKTQDDLAALQRLSGDSSLPFATIGSQQLKGFSDTEWTQFLDAAAYPRTSVLPASYRHEPATPLVAVTPASQTKPSPAAVASDAARPAAPAPEAANPAGIRF